MSRRASAGSDRWLGVGAALVLLGTQLLLAYATPRAHTAQLLTCFGLGTAAYVLLLRTHLSWRRGLLLALLLRLLWLPALPALSDDYHRFRWDGALVAAGQNPFQHRPEEYRAGGGALPDAPGLTPGLYQRLNSPHYYSVYPPVCQALFGLAAGLFPGQERAQVVVLRLALLLAEAATALLLGQLLRLFGQRPERAFLYLLHPLTVAELVGNLHFEAIVIAGTLAALWLLARYWSFANLGHSRPADKSSASPTAPFIGPAKIEMQPDASGTWINKLLPAAGALAIAIAAKLTPLLLLPLLPRRLGWGRATGLGLLTGSLVALSFGPFASLALLRHIISSLDLYFHSFEFNASLYYLLRAIGYGLTGYNEIARLGTGLALAAALGVLLLAALEKRPTLATLPRAALLAFTLYYMLATTVHPWYLTPLLALSCFTGWRYPATWAALATLSYATYRTTAYHENLYLVALEYSGLALAAYFDWRRQQTRPSSAASAATQATDD